MAQGPLISLDEQAQWNFAAADPGGSGDLDLAALSGYPNFPPQEVYFHNSTGSAANVEYTPVDPKGNTDQRTVAVAAGATIRIPMPVEGVGDQTAAGIVLFAFWRSTNPDKVTVNS